MSPIKSCGLLPILLLLSTVSPVFSHLSLRYQNNVNVFGLVNAGHQLGALEGGGTSIGSRQEKCVNPAWVPLCGGALPCAPPGAACCGTSYYYFPETEFCCPAGEGSCPLGTTCCDPFCCIAGATCSNGMCVRATTATQTRTSTSTSSSTSTSTSSSTSSSILTRTTPTTTTSITRTTSQSTGTRTSTSRSTSTSTEEDDDSCTVPPERIVARGLPTMTVPYVERQTVVPNSGGKTLCIDNREVMNSMCKGIKKNRGCVANEMKLNYRPDLEKVNRDAMCPKGFCDSVNTECLDPNDRSGNCNPYANFMTNPINDYKYDVFHMSCDEFPFAKSLQGGKPGTGTSICVPGWQNSHQGGKLNQLGRKVGAGNDYVIQVTGWNCKTGRPTGTTTNCKGTIRRRDDVGGNMFTEDDFYTNFTESGEHALMMYLGDVDPGVYTYNLTLGTGTLTDVRAIDNEGETIGTPVGTLNAGGGTHTVTVRVDDAAYGVALWGFTTDTKVSVAYNITSAPLPAAAPNGTATPGVSLAGRQIVGGWTVVGVVVGAGFWLGH